MHSFGLARLGKDVEIRHTGSGDAVAGLALAFSWGKKGDDGRRQTTWLDASLWGKRAEALAPYLTKGTLVFVSVSDVHMEQYESSTRTGHKLVGRVTEIELAGGGQRHDSAPQASRAPQRQAAPAGEDFLDDQIPF